MYATTLVRRVMMKQLMIICVVVIGVAGAARAAPTTWITFDEFPVGTIITNQYVGLGVVFLPGNVTGRQPKIANDAFMPNSPVLRPTGEPDFYQYQGDFSMQFITPATEVQFDSGFWDGLATGVINAYDSTWNPLASLTNTGVGVELISISGVGPISYVYFSSIGDPAGAGIDNLGFSISDFDPNPVPAVPAPGAIALGGIGLGLVGWLRRRRTL
jgi:hypothetical protein